MKALENRIPPPVVAMAMMVMMGGASYWLPTVGMPPMWRYGLTAVTSVFAMGMAGAGILAFLRAKTTIDPVQIEQASRLVSTGVYGISRNPMYVGLTAALMSWGIWLSAPWTFVGPLVFAVFVHRFQILPEERVMKAKFGAEYEAYRRRVRRWI